MLLNWWILIIKEEKWVDSLRITIIFPMICKISHISTDSADSRIKDLLVYTNPLQTNSFFSQKKIEFFSDNASQLYFLVNN